jgi:hypothetical protein
MSTDGDGGARSPDAAATDAAAEAAVRPLAAPDLGHVDDALGTGAPAAAAPAQWAPVPRRAPRAAVAPGALVLAIAGLVASLFVGWAAPVGLAAVVAAVVALRRPVESRAMAWWALALAVLSLVYSAGWLLWSLPQL